MKLTYLVGFMASVCYLTSAYREDLTRRRVQIRDNPKFSNSCPQNYTAIDPKDYQSFIEDLSGVVKSSPPPLRKRGLPNILSLPRSTKFARGTRGGASGYAGRYDQGSGNGGWSDAFRIDGRGQRSYYDDYGYGYDSTSQYDNLLGNVASDETFQEVMANGCWWVVKSQFERLKQDALRSAKRHFQDYVNRVAQHGGHWLFETVTGTTMAYYRRWTGPKAEGSKRDTSPVINVDDTEDLGFAINMEVQFRNGVPPYGAPDPAITKLVNIVDENMMPVQGHVEGFWKAENYIGGTPHPRRDNLPRDDPFDNQCHFSTWDTFRTHMRSLYKTVVVPLFLRDNGITGIELNLVSPGAKSVYKGWQGGYARVRFWISPAPTLSDTATFQKVNFEDAPNCLSPTNELQFTSLKYAECYLSNEQTQTIAPPTKQFWNKASDACRQAFHGSTAPENHRLFSKNKDPPKSFHYYDDSTWSFEYVADRKCTTPFLCSTMFGNSGDGTDGAAADHWDKCDNKDQQGDHYFGGLIYPNLASQYSTELKRQSERLDDQNYLPCGVMNIYPKKSGTAYDDGAVAASKI